MSARRRVPCSALAVACGPTTLTAESAGSETASGGGSSSPSATETGVDKNGCPTPAEFCRGAPLDLEAVAAGDGGFAVAGDEVPEALGDVNGDGLGFAGFAPEATLFIVAACAEANGERSRRALALPRGRAYGLLQLPLAQVNVTPL